MSQKISFQDNTTERILTASQKALRINLSPNVYGSFAEIGAGQEVADIFFKAGAASGTIAKAMSAYDKAFSDAIYGPESSNRYVCESRLAKMLEHEFSLFEERLEHREETTAFFAFANTVEVLNFQKTNKGHGWIGIKYQTRPLGPVNTVILHVRFFDNHRHLQQEACGIIGTNLIYACYAYFDNIDLFINSLMENLSRDRVELDMLSIKGEDFNNIDNRLVALKLVKQGISNAAMFGPDGEVLQASEALYKKNILALRGRFRPVTHVNIDMLTKGREMFLKEEDVDEKSLIVLSELTLANLKGKDSSEIDEQDFLDRVDILCSLGQTVLISAYQEYYRLVEYLSLFTRGKKIGILLGVYSVNDIFKEKFYSNLNGGLLEALGRLFGHNVKLYVYPAKVPGSNDILGIENFQLDKNIVPLFEYLKINNKLCDIDNVNTDLLHIFSDQVLMMIKSGTTGWESMVPPKVAEAIKNKCLFDYPCEI